jgi:hypothetical protein
LTGQAIAITLESEGSEKQPRSQGNTVNATARKLINRTLKAIRSAVQLPRAVKYAILNGPVGTLVANGDLVTASTHLVRLGLAEDDIRSFRSHYGKTVKAAYRKATGGSPLTCWIDIDGHYRSCCVYLPYDRSLAAGATTYKRLAAIVNQAEYTEAA